jgi:hypothetical protein
MVVLLHKSKNAHGRGGAQRTDSCSIAGIKACHEKLRRERLNDRFQDLSSVSQPGRPTKIDRPVMLYDAITVLNQLKNEV